MDLHVHLPHLRLHYDAEGAFAGWGGCFGTSSFTTAYQVQKIVRFKY